MVTSILHRATGVVLTLGSLLIVWALWALATGPEQWATFGSFARSIPGLVVLVGWSWALAYHLVNGIRHLLQDAGLGFRIETFVRNSWISVIGSLLLTAAIWVVAVSQWGAS